MDEPVERRLRAGRVRVVDDRRDDPAAAGRVDHVAGERADAFERAGLEQRLARDVPVLEAPLDRAVERRNLLRVGNDPLKRADVSVLDMLADAKIAAAIEAGELANLPGEGKPLDLDDDPLVPEDLRVAWRILKNSGFVPPEIAERRERVALVGLLATIEDESERRRAAARLALLEARREDAGARSGLPASYRGALLDKLGR